MKKILFIFLCMIQFMYAFDVKTAAKIYDKLFYGIFQKDKILVYAKEPLYKSMILSAQNLQLTENIDEAAIVIITSPNELNNRIKNKIIFATTNQIFQENENAIGAFYWQKGRPEIIFSAQRLNKLSINISNDLERFVK